MSSPWADTTGCWTGYGPTGTFGAGTGASITCGGGGGCGNGLL